jgi:uroporphyrinogen-III synthase
MAVSGALSGRRIVVTRAADQADELAELLSAHGAEVVLLPTIAVVDAADGGAALREALADLDDVAWLVVTSPNGARRVAAALADREPGRPLLAAVGAATAAALGRPADLVPADQIAEGLVDAFPTGSGVVVLAQAADARSALAAGLSAKGWIVRTVTAYRTVIGPGDLLDDPDWRAARDAARSADAVVFTSGSTARGWASSVDLPLPAVTVAIGPATEAVARQETLKITHVAADHSLGGVVATLLEIFQH